MGYRVFFADIRGEPLLFDCYRVFHLEKPAQHPPYHDIPTDYGYVDIHRICGTVAVVRWPNIFCVSGRHDRFSGSRIHYKPDARDLALLDDHPLEPILPETKPSLGHLCNTESGARHETIEGNRFYHSRSPLNPTGKCPHLSPLKWFETNGPFSFCLSLASVNGPFMLTLSLCRT